MDTPFHFVMTKSSSQSRKKTSLLYRFRRQAESFEKSRLGWMALLITIQSCIGSLACMYILQYSDSFFMLALCATITMVSNAVLIAQAEAKICLGLFYTSLLVNITLSLLNIFLFL